jgi:hypothetical protein
VAVLRAMTTLVVAGLLVGAPEYARAQDQPGVGVVTTLVGDATVARAAMVQEQSLKKNDAVFPQDRLTTKEHSLVHVLLGGKALLTVRELSVLTVAEEGGRATVNLHSGKVGLAVARERMRPGEAIEVHTLHAVVAVRGTVLVVELIPDPAGGNRSGISTNVHLLHGKLDVSLRSNPGMAPVRLETLQSVTVSANAIGAVQQLSPAAAAAVTANLKVSQPEPTGLPEKFQSALDERHRVLAVGEEGAVDGGTTRKGQDMQSWAEKKVEDDEDLWDRNSNDSTNDGGPSKDGGTGRVKGSAPAPVIGSGQVIDTGPSPARNGFLNVVPLFQRQKGK